MPDKIEHADLKEKANLIYNISMQHAHPFQDVEEFNEWREINHFAEVVLRYIKEQEDTNE